jgi:hypothetical protein
MRLNVLDFSSPSFAIAAASDGDAIYFPACYGSYVAPSGGWQVTKSLQIYGDGPGAFGATSGSILTANSAADNIFNIVGPVRNVAIRDLQLRGATGTGGGCGIVSTGSDTTQTEGLLLRNLLVSGCGGDGIKAHNPIGMSVRDSVIRGCVGAGIRITRYGLDQRVGIYVQGTSLEGNQGNGMIASGVRVGVFDCNFDGNAAAPGVGADLEVDSAGNVRVQGCRFVNFDIGNIKMACAIYGPNSGVVGLCYFETNDAAANCTGIDVSSPGFGCVTVLPNHFKRTKNMVRIWQDTVECTILPQYDESGTGTIYLHTNHNDYFGMWNMTRLTSNAVRGLIVPGMLFYSQLKGYQGMLVYNDDPNAPALKVYVNGQWRTVQYT